MTPLERRIAETVAFIRQSNTLEPAVALILGSGLGDFANALDARMTFQTSALPHYPVGSVPGHKGAIVFGTMRGQPIVVFQGRVHLYESGSIETVCYPVHIARALGAGTLIVTNAAGGINREFSPGDLMLIADQINLTGSTVQTSPLNDRHARMLYDPVLVESTLRLAVSLGVPVRRGVYASVRGPSYETAAEVDMLHRAGADAVGMSTVHEVELAFDLRMKVLGISCITNKATGVGSHKLDHREVTEVASRVNQDFTRLLTEGISLL